MQRKEAPESLVLAIDLGGTKMLTALVSDSGEIIDRHLYPTLADEGAQSVIDRMVSAIDDFLKRSNVNIQRLYAISIAAAGVIEMNKGIITSSPNLPGWIDIPLRDIIQKRFKVDVFLINDANAAILGEHEYGVGKRLRDIILLTLGTGIGGGIIIDNRLYCGVSGGAGEFGHMTINVNGPECNCGGNGCLELFASGKAIAAEAIRRINNGEKSILVEMVANNLHNITAEKVSIAAQEGDKLSIDVIDKAAYYLGTGMVNLINIFNPEMIIVGGGMSALGELLLGPARKVVREKAYRLPAQAARIVTAQLGSDAGVYGAALFAFKQGNV